MASGHTGGVRLTQARSHDDPHDEGGLPVTYIKGYDPQTLREMVDPRECQERLDELGDQRSLPALLERVWLLKVLGRWDESLVVSEQSVRVARMGGTRKDLLRARILHASVLQVRGAYASAHQELNLRRRGGRAGLGSPCGVRLPASRQGELRRRGLRRRPRRLQARAVPPPGGGCPRGPARVDARRDRRRGPAAHGRLGRQLSVARPFYRSGHDRTDPSCLTCRRCVASPRT